MFEKERNKYSTIAIYLFQSDIYTGTSGLLKQYNWDLIANSLFVEEEKYSSLL